MKKTKFIAFVLSCAMLLISVVGCGAKIPDYGTIDGKKIDGKLFNVLASSMLASYSSYGYDEAQIKEMLKQDVGDGTTVGDSMKAYCLDTIKQYIAIENFAKENSISLTSEDKASLEDSKKQAIESAGGRAAFVASLKEQGVYEEIYDYMQELNLLNQKVFSALFNVGGIYEVDEETVIKSVVTENARVIHILVMGSEEDADYAEKKAKAEALLARAKSGEDFETLVAEEGEDPGMVSYKDGYVFNASGILADNPSTTFDPDFTAASFELPVGGISDVVASTSGLHIIKRLPLDEAFVSQNIDRFYSAQASNAFGDMIYDITETLEVKTTDAYDSLDMASLIPSHEGHDHN